MDIQKTIIEIFQLKIHWFSLSEYRNHNRKSTHLVAIFFLIFVNLKNNYLFLPQFETFVTKNNQFSITRALERIFIESENAENFVHLKNRFFQLRFCVYRYIYYMKTKRKTRLNIRNENPFLCFILKETKIT